MTATVLMVQGASSDAGKSILVAGICRVLARRGIRVAPFKPQNMALNSAVTPCGGEIGRAQALQAQACRIAPSTDMNPILLKPERDSSAQVIVHGKVRQRMDARAYHDYKCEALDYVMESFTRLQQHYDCIIVEGAGSPAEINLRDNDIANMGFAEAANCPVLVVADIDRGGVFASLIGTLELLGDSERERVSGFVINKFRGDIRLLEPGLRWLESTTGKPVVGVVPYLKDFYVDAEDAVDTQQQLNPGQPSIVVCVIRFARISNHTDFDPLRQHPAVDLRFIAPGSAIPSCDLIILPGSKNVRADLVELLTGATMQSLQHHLRYGGKVLGLCGGYQMLGDIIHDRDGVEDAPGSSAGLGLLPLCSELKQEKRLIHRRGRLAFSGAPVCGYEIHCGITTGDGIKRPLITFADGSIDGARSTDGQVMGCYLHGLFDEPEACSSLLDWAGLKSSITVDVAGVRETQLERLADTVEGHLMMAELLPGLLQDRHRTPSWRE